MDERGNIQTHRDQKVSQLGMDLTEHVFELTTIFPDSERFGLISQLRRAAASLPANMAEGNARSSTKEYLRRLSIAVGSLAEVQTFLKLASRLRYGTETNIYKIIEMVTEERRMLRGLQRSLQAKPEAVSKPLWQRGTVPFCSEDSAKGDSPRSVLALLLNNAFPTSDL